MPAIIRGQAVDYLVIYRRVFTDTLFTSLSTYCNSGSQLFIDGRPLLIEMPAINFGYTVNRIQRHIVSYLFTRRQLFICRPSTIY